VRFGESSFRTIPFSRCWLPSCAEILFVGDDGAGVPEKEVASEGFDIVIPGNEYDLERAIGKEAISKVAPQLFNILWPVKEVPADREDVCVMLGRNGQYLLKGGKPLVCVRTEVDVCRMNE
jgi:hypothetical protein